MMKHLAALLVVASVCLWSIGDCVPVPSPDDSHSLESDEIHLPLNPTLADLQRERQRFILELREIERDIDEDLLKKNFGDVRKESRKLERIVWPRLVELNGRILKTESVDTAAETNLHAELKQIHDRIKTKAGNHGQ